VVSSASLVHWSLPQQLFYKANFGGALFQDITSAGTLVVIRDLVGQIIGSLSERIVLPPTVYDVEALAYRMAIAFTLEIGL